MGYTLFTYDNIPFNFIQKHKNAIRVRLGHTRQNIFIPVSYFYVSNDKYYINKNCDLNWLFKKKDTISKMDIYKQEIESDEK